MKLFEKKILEEDKARKQVLNEENPLHKMLNPRILTEKEFKHVSDKIYDLCKINLHNGKKELVQARLNKRLGALELNSYKEYLLFVENDQTGKELIEMVDVLTTNLTFFFREPDHFDFLAEEVLSKLDTNANGKFRIWSAGCSTGEEPYTLAILMKEHVPNIDRMDSLILATDISTRVLAKAANGLYEGQNTFKNTPSDIRSKYFTKVQDTEQYKIAPELSKMIRFRRLNLMEKWPFKGLFDVVFCRNVMIYFDKTTQNQLVNRFYDVVKPGGYFMVGHSESLSGIKHEFKYIRPSVYKK